MGQPLRPGNYVSLAGALAAALSAVMPWYRIDFGAAFTQAVGQQADQVFSPTYAGLVHGVLGLIPPSVTLTGYKAATHSGPKASLIILAVGVLAVIAIFTQARRTATLVAGAGITGVAAWHIFIDKYMSGVPGLTLHYAYGAYVALAGGIALLVGSLMALGNVEKQINDPWAKPVAPGQALVGPADHGTDVRPSSVAPPNFSRAA